MAVIANWESVDEFQKKLKINLAAKQKVASTIERWKYTFGFTNGDLEGAVISYYVRGQQKYSKWSEQATFVNLEFRKGKWHVSQWGRTYLNNTSWEIELLTEPSEGMVRKALIAMKRF